MSNQTILLASQIIFRPRYQGGPLFFGGSQPDPSADKDNYHKQTVSASKSEAKPPSVREYEKVEGVEKSDNKIVPARLISIYEVEEREGRRRPPPTPPTTVSPEELAYRREQAQLEDLVRRGYPYDPSFWYPTGAQDNRNYNYEQPTTRAPFTTPPYNVIQITYEPRTQYLYNYSRWLGRRMRWYSKRR